MGSVHRVRRGARQVWWRMWALVVVLSVVAGSLPLASAPGQVASASSAGAQAARTRSLAAPPEPQAGMGGLDHYVYLPLVVKNAMASPGDALIVSWTQTTEGATRMVLLHWRSRDVADMAAAAATGGSYAVSRRVEGQTTWQSLGNAVPAATPTAMVSILGQDLADHWRTICDPIRRVRRSHCSSCLTACARTRRRHGSGAAVYKVGLATGMATRPHGAPECDVGV